MAKLDSNYYAIPHGLLCDIIGRANAAFQGGICMVFINRNRPNFRVTDTENYDDAIYYVARAAAHYARLVMDAEAIPVFNGPEEFVKTLIDITDDTDIKKAN